MRFLLYIFIPLMLICGCGQDSAPPDEHVLDSNQPVVVSNEDGKTRININGQIIEVDKDKSVELEIIQEKAVSSHGHNIRTSSEEVAQEISTESPSISFSDIFASGGNLSLEAKMRAVGSQGGILIMVGVATFLAGLAVAIWVHTGKGITIIGGGVSLIIMGFLFTKYPLVVLVAGVILLAAIGWYVYDQIQIAKTKEVNKRLVKGIAKANGGAAEVKQEIAKQDPDGLVKKTVSQIKAKEGIVNNS